MQKLNPLRVGWLTVLCLWSGLVWSADLAPVKKSGSTTAPGQPYNPEISKASAEGENAIKAFRKPADLDIKLVAAEPLLANPVCFCFDEKGRILVAETFRQQKGVEDNRGHMNWLDDDLAAQTVEDRLKFFEKHLKEKVQEYSKEQDRIRLLEDTDGDGKFEKATIFADGFNGILQGTGAGLLSWRGNVYYTCIPDLWLLRDNDGDGKAEYKKSLHYGYGVRVAFRGHDSHGLRMGPDGRIYFSIGDRGYHIETEGRTLAHPECGAVFRCNPDGSNLEVVATGLRNPQELVFDQYGNLFTGDNNSDSGDKARWTYIPEGADIGWRMYYQYLNDRGPWNREKIWHPPHAGQPAYIVPCITNLADGPSGLTYYPGWGLSERYQNHFFLADFRGGASNSGIRSFTVKPKGASFEVDDSHEFIWQILATDVEFGYDGGLYVSDWVSGWNGPGKGRMYRFAETSQAQAPLAAEVKKLFADGFTQRTASDLAKLITHVDYRVRLEAQLALADQGASAAPVFTEVAQSKANLLARLHAIWGLGQLGRRQADLLAPALALLEDQEAEVRVQAAKVLGEAKVSGAVPKLIAALRDSSPRVRMQAALTLGHYGDPSAVRPLLTLLEENNNLDPTLRHGAVMGLAGSNGEKELLAGANDGSPAARLGVLLAWRRLANPEIARFLNDTDPFLVDEAARAIHDLPLPAAMPALAKLASRSLLNDETWRRVISANFRAGTAENAAAVARLAARVDLSNAVRNEALNALGDWASPKGTDRVLGDWRPLEKRSSEIASAALTPALGGIFAGSDEVRKTGSQVAAKLGVKEVGPVLMGLVKDLQNPANVRVEALRALQSLKDKELPVATKLALVDTSPVVRSAGQRILAAQDPDAALKTFQQVLSEGSRPEQQSALATLAEMKNPEADALLVQQLAKLNDGQLAPELQLDILEAAGKRDVAALKSGVAAFEAARPKDNPLAAYLETLQGGDAQRGRTIFYERSQVSCVRCHKIGGEGGEVGPDLTKTGTEKKRDYLLEAIVDPNRQVAKGFETIVVTTTEGRTHAGILKAEDADKIQILTPEAKLITIPKPEIDERASGKSSMPESLVKQLSKQDLRDLVEFLASLKGK
ncbi:MAG: heme-binding protein [Planctomycetaceae bacterium]|nr:heme-binding protein [Planctomycetaceae bacterium]